jgi:chaperone BCS1
VFSPEEKEKQKQAKDKLKGVFSMYEKTNNKTQPQKKADNETLEKRVPSEKLSLSCLLNIFDGILETPGRIIIMTSNYPKKLDRALIRPGRIDLICEFTKCNHDMIVELFEAFYDVSISADERLSITNTPEYQYTPAELTKIMFENFDDYKGAIKKL